MEKSKKSKYFSCAGVIVALVWLLVSFFMLTVSAATSGSGNTTNSEFKWSWSTDNSATNADANVSGSLAGKTLTVNISANSSTYVAGSDGCGGVGATAAVNAAKTTNTVIITNNTGSTILISSINKTNVECPLVEGSKLGDGESFIISITANPTSPTDSSAQTAKGSVTIEFTEIASVNVTFYGADGVFYSYGETQLSNASEKISQNFDVGSSLTLPGTPTLSSGNFEGWRLSHDGSLRASGDKVTINNDTSIFPVVSASGRVEPFTVNGTPYKFWTDAAKAAGNSGTIILNQNYKLPASMVDNGVSPVGSPYISGVDGNINFIIPPGVTLLIPYDDDNTLCTTKPTITETNGTTSASAYRILTMEAGAHITVNGAISVSGQQYCSRPIGAVSGKYGAIEMADGSSITVESGGKLYAWGYIAGVKDSDSNISEGTITIKSNGTVYEDFQVVDWRGGSATTDMIDNPNKVFPMSQYYVQNVQVPMALESGATENAFTSIKVTMAGIQEAPITFIGLGGMFILGENTVVIKDYNEASDRLTLEIAEGSVSLGSVFMELQIAALSSKVTINSSNYVLPLNNNISIIANSGTVLSSSNSVAMLPGSELILEEGSNLNITSGNFYIYDLDEWTYDTTSEVMTGKLNGNTYNNGGYTSEFNYVMMAAPYSHGRVKTRTTADLKDAVVEVNGTITVSDDAYVYTTAGGANIYSTGSGKIEFKGAVGTATKTHQAVATGSDRTGVGYCDIAISAATLKNGDGRYVQTSAGTYTYCSDCMAWVCEVSTGHLGHATNVELGNGLNMYFAFWGDDITDGHYVVVRHGEEEIPFTSDQWLTTSIKINGNEIQKNAYVVNYDELSAKQMGDVITVTLYTSSGVVVDTWSNSIQHYAMRMLSKHSDNKELCTLIVDMLNYGAACQTESEYNTDHLVNAGLSAEQKSWATDKITIEDKSTQNNYHNSSNLVLTGNIQFVVAFNNSSTISKIEYTFANHWNDGENGEAVTREEPYYNDGPFSNKYLVVADARQMITITVYDRNGFMLGNWDDSVESYCARIISNASATEAQKAVCTAFMKFSDAAEAYLEGGNRI